MATKAGTTATNLARILIRDGLAKLATGEFTITPLAIESLEDGGDYAQRVLHNRWMMAKGKRFN